MKKFIFKIIIIFTIVAIFDYFFGVVMGHVVNNINVGGQGRDNYICNVAEEDILVFGSSRAVHHYNSTILEDSLGMSCYNCGEEEHTHARSCYTVSGGTLATSASNNRMTNTVETYNNNLVKGTASAINKAVFDFGVGANNEHLIQAGGTYYSAESNQAQSYDKNLVKIKNLSENGVNVCVWNVRSEQYKNALINNGATYVMTDYAFDVSPYQEGDVDFNNINV